MDLKAYKSQIRELVQLRNEADFNDLMDKILFGENNSDKFLIKMELNRLSKPCQRVLDLRDKITDPCELFEQENIKHYLTKPSIKVLQDNIKLYGLYTVGVFEAVHEFVAKQKEKQNNQFQPKPNQPVKKEQCELLSLSTKNKRGAARMFFVSEISATTSDRQKFKGQTSNISATGVKIKFQDDIHLINESSLAISFIGLTQEYHDKGLKEPVICQLIKQENDIDDYRYIYLNFEDSNKKFKAFISDFIRLNQYKYKIDVQYYYQLAKISALKHAYLSSMNSLSIFLDINNASPYIFALENDANKQILDKWQCNQEDQLAYFFNELNFYKLIRELKNKKSSIVYSFIHEAKGKQYFLSATEDDLIEQGLKELFVHTGCNKTSWCVYHLTLSTYHYQPNNSYDITESIPDIFNQITHMVTLQKLTQTPIFNRKKSLKNTDSSPLNQFVHRTEKQNKTGSVFSLFSSELRKEERYQYNTALSISDGKKQYTGQMIDFSCSGLKIKLTQITSFSVSSILTVNLNELQKISKAYSLTELQYKIVRVGANNILHLQVCEQETLDICQKFFSILVRNNAKHFKCQPLLEKRQPLQKQLIELAEESFNNAVFFVSKISTRPTISFSAIDIPEHPLHKLFSLNSENKDELNYLPIANNHIYERLVIAPFKEHKSASVIKEALIYIGVFKVGSKHFKISSFLEEDFNNEQEKMTFIADTHLNATFYALQFRLSVLPEMDLSCIKPEVRAISRFAMHLTKKLEEELHAVEGIIELTDITSDIIHALNKRK